MNDFNVGRLRANAIASHLEQSNDLEKSLLNDIFKEEQAELKKGKTVPVGTIRKRGNRSYIKTPAGWKYHSEGGKNAKKEKTANEKHIQALNEGATEVEADQIARGKRNEGDHSGKKTFEQVLADPEGKKLIEGIEGLDTSRADHKPLYADYKKQLKEKFGYDYKD